MEKADVFLFLGQSNMAGRGETCARFPQAAPAVIPGAGYEFRAVSDPERLYPLVEPFGATEDNPQGIDAVSYTHLDVYKRQKWRMAL